MIDMIVTILFYLAFFLVLLNLLIFYKKIHLGRLAKDFNCLMCGKCCHLLVRTTEEEIKKIEKETKISRKDFMDGKYFRRNKNKRCYFLRPIKESKGSHYKCSIYSIRPNVCSRFPFRKKLGGRLTIASTVNCPGLIRNSKLYY